MKIFRWIRSIFSKPKPIAVLNMAQAFTIDELRKTSGNSRYKTLLEAHGFRTEK